MSGGRARSRDAREPVEPADGDAHNTLMSAAALASLAHSVPSRDTRAQSPGSTGRR